jgi:hypothetical protein
MSACASNWPHTLTHSHRHGPSQQPLCQRLQLRTQVLPNSLSNRGRCSADQTRASFYLLQVRRTRGAGITHAAPLQLAGAAVLLRRALRARKDEACTPGQAGHRHVACRWIQTRAGVQWSGCCLVRPELHPHIPDWWMHDHMDYMITGFTGYPHQPAVPSALVRGMCSWPWRR